MSNARSILQTIHSALPVWKTPADQSEYSTAGAPRSVEFSGHESLDSVYAVTELACASVAAAACELSRYVDVRGGDTGSLIVDRRLCSLWFGLSTKPVGWEFPSIWDELAGDYPVKDGWVRLHTNSPQHRQRALDVLDCAGSRDTVAAVVSACSGADLERNIVDAGGCAAHMMNREQWLTHPQGAAVSREPLVGWSTIGQQVQGNPNQSTTLDAKKPLSGLKVLDLTRVLAGPACTRFLSAFGAEVLRIDPPHWNEFLATVEMSVGKRRAGLDLKNSADLEVLKNLMRDADVLVHGYRPDALERLGLGSEIRAAINPCMVDVALSAYGWSGPWAQRRGFDSLVQMSSGIAAAGMLDQQADRPVPLPVQALDHATGYLMAAAVLNALCHRCVTGEIRRARLSLARTAELLVAGHKDQVTDVTTGPLAGDYQRTAEATTWGQLSRLQFPLQFENTPMCFDHPAGELRVAEAAWSR